RSGSRPDSSPQKTGNPGRRPAAHAGPPTTSTALRYRAPATPGPPWPTAASGTGGRCGRRCRPGGRRAARARVRSCAFEVRPPVGLDLLDQLRRKRHVVERACLLLAVLKGPGEERARVAAALRILWRLVHEREYRCRDRPGLLARGVGDHEVEVA